MGDCNFVGAVFDGVVLVLVCLLGDEDDDGDDDEGGGDEGDRNGDLFGLKVPEVGEEDEDEGFVGELKVA